MTRLVLVNSHGNSGELEIDLIFSDKGCWKNTRVSRKKDMPMICLVPLCTYIGALVKAAAKAGEKCERWIWMRGHWVVAVAM